MTHPCGKFGDCSFSRFGFIMRTNRHTQKDTEERYTRASLIGVSKERKVLPKPRGPTRQHWSPFLRVFAETIDTGLIDRVVYLLIWATTTSE